MGEDNYSLGSRVFHMIRENILSGKYERDEELKEKSIGEELGVSRTPVREALRQLELEGDVYKRQVLSCKNCFIGFKHGKHIGQHIDRLKLFWGTERAEAV